MTWGRALLVGGVVLVAGSVAGLWLVGAGDSQKIALRNGGELRVLKVSVGTNHFLSFEPGWKQWARRLMPKATESAWGAFKGQRAQTKWDAMVVWLDEGQMPKGQWFFIEKAESVFTNGFASEGRVDGKTGLMRLTFPCFQRESQMVPLRLRQGTNVVEFQVRNPKVTQPARWTALPIPQTQTVNRAHIVFRGYRSEPWRKPNPLEILPSVLVRATKPSWAGFVAWWHVTAFDRWGNYSQGRQNWSDPSFAALPPGRGPWRIVMDGEEYLSAGYLPEPTNELAMIVSPTPRMKDFGIQFLMMVGPGVYTITNGILAGKEGLPMGTGGSEVYVYRTDFTGQTNKFATQVTGMYCVSEVLPGVPLPRMRLHERNWKNEGATWPSHCIHWETYPVGSTTRRVQFFKAPLPKVWKNKYEFEMIFDLATEFFVEEAGREQEK